MNRDTMPRRAKTKTVRAGPVVGPYDLGTMKLPGGTELEALGLGFIHQKTAESLRSGFRRGYTVAATKANQNILADQAAAWILADSKTGLLRSQTASQLFQGEHKTAMDEIFSKEGGGAITGRGFARGHAWKKEVGLQRNKPLTGPL